MRRTSRRKSRIRFGRRAIVASACAACALGLIGLLAGATLSRRKDFAAAERWIKLGFGVAASDALEGRLGSIASDAAECRVAIVAQGMASRRLALAETSERCYEAGVRIAEVYLGLAKASYLPNEAERAIAWLREGREEHPKNGALARELAERLRESGDRGEAVRAYTKALALEGASPEFLFGALLFLSEAGAEREAESAAGRIEYEKIGNPEFLLKGARALAKAGSEKRAAAWIDRSVVILLDHPELHRQMLSRYPEQLKGRDLVRKPAGSRGPER